ncbi:MAG: DNA recombination protein RmuC [Betaproteobacteria bacterium]|nr:DNA recombination protein RmuC [Betaproteobacteria bacterium]
MLAGALALLVIAGFGIVFARIGSIARTIGEHSERQAILLEEKHRLMLSDLHEGLERQGDRLSTALADSSERLRALVGDELRQARDALQQLQVTQGRGLADTREAMIGRLSELAITLQTRLAEQGRADQELIQTTLRNTSQQLIATIESLTKTTDSRLNEISGKVTERLEEGFKKTNETFVSVMARLATIDEAQKKIDGLTTNVVSLQELLGDKRARGAFGEVQLENLVRNTLPPTAYELQATLSNKYRADCILKLPEPTGNVAVDSKFPLENYRRMFAPGIGEADRAAAQKLFKQDVKKHLDDICTKYIIPGETSDGAVMFLPAEAVFAEIHAYHPDLVDYAMQKRVWIVSPTTLMAILNTARAVIKDVETRKQVHIIKDELGKLGKDFGRFDERMRKLADHIRQANQDAEQVQISSKAITRRFQQIEAVDLGEQHGTPARLLESGE